MRRYLTLFVLLPLAAVVILLSVVNRGVVSLVFDPFGNPPAYTLDTPVYLLIFSAFALGAIAGGAAVWVRQSRWRRAARTERSRAAGLQGDVARLRQRAQASPAQPILPAGPGNRTAA
ncbi:MAG: lipopolysaccharide assembly protein LapA domain-containing protein [Alphaproteobacteria bacterium]